MVTGRSLTDRQAIVGVTLVALLLTASGLGNGFAYDDIPVIVENTDLHQPGTALSRAFEPYLGGQMLRPVPLLGFAGQWWIGGGSPLPFRSASLALYALVSALVYLLCRRMGALPPAALIAGLVFAVHPVHTEVTANSVSQSELLSGMIVIASVLWYIRGRTSGGWRRRDTFVLALAYLLATHTKEVGYILPGLLLAVELLIIPDARRWSKRSRELRELYLVLTMTMFASLWLRELTLGSLGGGGAHLSLTDLSLPQRISVVLTLIPEWSRLLLWPARLQVEYGPPALDPGMPMAVRHLLGVAIAAVAVGCSVAWWRRIPLAAVGMAWMAISLLPVANLLFPTGVLIAERTLFLPSIGLAMVVAGVSGWAGPRLGEVQGRSWPMPALAALGALLLAAGAWRTAIRQPVWRDTLTVLRQGVADSPTTYRAHLVLGRKLAGIGDQTGAETAYRQAVGLWQRDPRPFEELGQMLRSRGDCAGAIPVLEAGVRADSTSDVARSRLVECLIVERRWEEAAAEAERGLAQGVPAYRTTLARITARRGAVPDAR